MMSVRENFLQQALTKLLLAPIITHLSVAEGTDCVHVFELLKLASIVIVVRKE